MAAPEVNGKTLGTATSQFIRYTFDLSPEVLGLVVRLSISYYSLYLHAPLSL